MNLILNRIIHLLIMVKKLKQLLRYNFNAIIYILKEEELHSQEKWIIKVEKISKKVKLIDHSAVHYQNQIVIFGGWDDGYKL